MTDNALFGVFLTFLTAPYEQMIDKAYNKILNRCFVGFKSSTILLRKLVGHRSFRLRVKTCKKPSWTELVFEKKLVFLK